MGLPTAGGPVPIVVGAVLYDLGVGNPAVRPRALHGYEACESAVAGAFERDVAESEDVALTHYFCACANWKWLRLSAYLETPRKRASASLCR